MQARPELIRPEHIRLGPQGPEVFGPATDLIRAFALIERVEHGLPRERRLFQEERIAAVTAHARRHSAFWRARLPSGQRPLGALPVLTRAELRRQVAEEGALPLPPEHGEARENTTSGATSEPLRFFVSTLNGDYNRARYAFDDIAGDRRLDLPLTVFARRITEKQRLDRWPTITGEIWRTGPGALVPLLGDAESMLDGILDGPGGHLAIRPLLVDALVRRVIATGRRPPPLGELLTFGETMPAALREEAEAVLGARVADRYSCEELGPVSIACRSVPTHQHVCASNVVVEVVDEARRPVPEGMSGDLLLTGLNAMATPVIRYDVGDRAALLPRCPCGHRGPVLTALVGRRNALLRLPDGRLGYFKFGSGFLLALAPITGWRLTQTGRTTLHLQVAAARPLTEAERATLCDRVLADSSRDLSVTFEQVAALDLAPGAKGRMVVNLLEEDATRT